MSERAQFLDRRPEVVAAHRRSSLWPALLGLLGALSAPFYVYWVGFTLVDLSLFLGMYWLTLGVGLAVGYHRHFTHGAFQTHPALRWVLAVLGSMGAQGPLTYWVAVHRRHHEHGDVEGDPHSPSLHGHGFRAQLAGLWHAHFGWSLAYGMPSVARYCSDLTRERRLMLVARGYWTWVGVGLLLPSVIGGLVTQSFTGALGGLLWGGLVRLFLTSHATWSLNSICHRFGARPFATSDHSTNNAWLALPTLGESWHNNHHAQPTSAAHGLRWWQLDLNHRFIRLLEALHLAWDVKGPARDQN